MTRHERTTSRFAQLAVATMLLALSAGAAAQTAPRYHVAPLAQGGPHGDATTLCTESFGHALEDAGGYTSVARAESPSDSDVVVILTAHDALGSWYISGRVLSAENGATVWTADDMIDGEAGALALRNACGWLAYHYLEETGATPPAFSSLIARPSFARADEPVATGIPLTELATYVARARNRDLPADEWEEAVDLFRRGCEADQTLGCSGLARMYRLGFGVDRDYSLAFTLYEDACNDGDAESCNDLGRMYREGQGVREDRDQALGYFRIACDAGFEDGCENLGQRYQRSAGHMGDFGRTSSLYRRACDNGIMSGCTGLGYVFETGDGLEQDLDRAHAFYERACDGGDQDGCARLGSLYERGDVVGQDRARALQLYGEACEAGSALGCDFAGSVYRDGIGVTADPERALELFQEACRSGNPHACGQLH